METRQPTPVGEKLLALVTPEPRSQRLIRRAWRSAQRLGAELDLLWVAPAGEAQKLDTDPKVAAMQRLAAVLGANMIIEPSDDLILTAGRVARERAATYILIGPPQPRVGLRRFRASLVDRLLEEVPGVDIRVVADRTKIGGDGP